MLAPRHVLLRDVLVAPRDLVAQQPIVEDVGGSGPGSGLRMLAAAGRGAGFRRVMTKPVTSAAPPTTASSRLELEPKLELSSPSVPTSAPPV